MACAISTSAINVWAQEMTSDKGSFSLFNRTPNGEPRKLSADRPDKTDSPFTVDAGHFQVEMDFANYNYSMPNVVRSNVKSEGYHIAPMNLKVGLFNDLDFQIVLSPWQWERAKDENTAKVVQKSGIGDIVVRGKMNLIGNDGGFFALAIIPFLKLPTAQDHLGNGAVEGGLGIPYAFDAPGWDVGFQSTFSWNYNDSGSAHHAQFENSVSIGHAVIGILSYHVEFFNGMSAEKNSGPLSTFDTWLTCQVDKDLCLDTGVYIGLTGTADDWHPWLGMALRF